jgi:hypothetical protein
MKKQSKTKIAGEFVPTYLAQIGSVEPNGDYCLEEEGASIQLLVDECARDMSVCGINIDEIEGQICIIGGNISFKIYDNEYCEYFEFNKSKEAMPYQKLIAAIKKSPKYNPNAHDEVRLKNLTEQKDKLDSKLAEVNKRLEEARMRKR